MVTLLRLEVSCNKDKQVDKTFLMVTFFIGISVNVAKSSRQGKSRRSDIKGKETLRQKSNGGKKTFTFWRF